VSDKTSRWLDLVAFLLSHRFAVTRAQIFRQVGGYEGAEETARRKFERDKDELRALGVEIETVEIPGASSDEAGTGYRLKPRHSPEIQKMVIVKPLHWSCIIVRFFLSIN
jgi:proteasome accessory factor B